MKEETIEHRGKTYKEVPEEGYISCNGCDIYVKERKCTLDRSTVCIARHTILKEAVPSLSPKEMYKKLAEKWLELTGVKVGDEVRIVNHIPCMGGVSVMGSTNVNSVHTVTEVSCNGNLRLSDGFYWNYFNLEKVERKANVTILPTEMTVSHSAVDVTITKDGADICGQKYSIDTLKKICAMSEEVGRLGINSTGHFLIGEYSSNRILLNRKDINAISEAIKELGM